MGKKIYLKTNMPKIVKKFETLRNTEIHHLVYIILSKIKHLTYSLNGFIINSEIANNYFKF